MYQTLRFLILLAIVSSASLVPLHAQIATGTPPFASFGGGPDIVNLANLNVHLDIPVINKAGRGTNFTYDLSYDSSVWYPSSVNGTNTWTPVYNWGWRAVTEASTGYVSYTTTTSPWCLVGNTYYGQQTAFSNWVYHDPWGVLHGFAITTYYYQGSPAECANAGSSTTATGISDGYTLKVTGGTVNSLVGATGKIVNPPVNIGTGTGNFTDRNGNQITVDGSGHFYDTLSSSAAALTVAGSGTASSPMTFSYTAPSGATPQYIVNYTNYTIATNFGAGISEYKSSAAVPLVTSIALPDHSQYSFTYESTPGSCTPYSGTTCVTARLISVTLPSGGTITYSYSGGNNGILSDGSAATLTRKTPDGTWTYAQVKNSGAASTTTVTDPASDVTTINFQGIYETQRVVVDHTAGTLLTRNTCYNNTAIPCTSNAVSWPITQRSASTQLPGSSNLTDLHQSTYDAYGNLLTQTDYDYGPGAHGNLLDTTTITYASLGNIVAFPQTATVTNASGTTVSKTNYNYDETTPQTTTGTPQHTSVSGSRGNLTSANYYTQGSTTLTAKNSYFDTGNVQTATDTNNAQTTYVYNDATSTCGNTFPDSVNEPLSMSRSFTWNCTGGVQTALADENSNTTTTGWSDGEFWRPSSITDPTNAQFDFLYSTETVTETTLSFGSSTVDTMTTLDGLGRLSVSQRRQAPGSTNFDSVEHDYDKLGRPSRTTLPYVGSANQTNSTAPANSTNYDALNRPITIVDGGGGTSTYTYSQNDVLISVTPAPTGENSKQRQLEYDALGHLTSVCEITSAAGSGTCGQTNAKTGYWTKYTYNALGQITGVTQNAQAASGTQSRAYSYDLMSRLITETNPENGTTTYVYDSDSTCGTSSGDLVKKTDAAGNVTCLSYDALHRLTSKTYPSGTYASTTAAKYFVYDSATVDLVSMSNAKGRLAEAYTSGPVPIQNSGFEASTSLPPPGWTANSATLSYDTSTPYAGSRSLKTAATALYGGAVGIVQIGVVARQYTISGYVKSDGVCYTDIQLMFLNSSKGYVGGVQAFGGTATSWTFVTATGTAPAGTYFTQISLQNQTTGGAGVCEFDNISVTTNAWVTDQGFSYTARGQVSDQYLAAPDTGYFHANYLYYPNGVVQQVSGLPTLPTFTYGLDGEGRVATLSASTGQNPLTATTYNTAGLPTGLTFGSGDTDAYTYDPNTNRMTQYQFNVNGSSFVGKPTWNANGTLGSLAITDPFNSSDNQTCNYTHDDLVRIAAANCGSVWSQTFSYDPFGNLNKNGTSAFQPTYNSATNRFTSLPSCTPTYDGDGNVLNDCQHQYTWDADGHYTAIDTTVNAFDAFGRLTEIELGPGFQYFYLPDGSTVFFEGPLARRAKLKLPGGATVNYDENNGTGLLDYTHPDHLGSVRLTSSPTRAYMSSLAYAPFSEMYAMSGWQGEQAFTGMGSNSGDDSWTFPARQYSNQGRWVSPDPAGLAAVNPANPQSWNRYAYVLNDPCTFVDPLGLSQCDFNVLLNNDIGLGQNMITAIENRINQIFSATPSPSGDTVGINFVSSGQADTSLTITNASWFTNMVLGSPYGVQGGFWGAPKVYANNLPSSFPTSDTANQMGGVGAHELAHVWLGGDLPYNTTDPNLMMFDTAPPEAQLGALINTNSALWKVTANQVADLYSKCSKKPPKPPQKTGTGGGSGNLVESNSFNWLYFIDSILDSPTGSSTVTGGFIPVPAPQ